MSEEKDKKDPWPWDDNWTPKLEKLIYRLIARKSAGGNTDGDVPTANDSESNAMLKSHAYLTQTSGFVDATILSTTNAIQLFVGTTNDPAGAGTMVAQQRANAASSDSHAGCFVASGKYFEVVSASTPTILWSPLVTGGGAPIDQD